MSDTQIPMTSNTGGTRAKTYRSTVATDAVEARHKCKHCRGSQGRRKWSFPNEELAWQMIGKILRSEYNGYDGDVPNRVYPCPRGDGYHMTGKDQH